MLRSEFPAESCPLCKSDQTRQWLQAPDRFHGRKALYSLARCANCGLVWQSRPPRGLELAAHYGPLYHRAITKAAESSVYKWTGFRDVVLGYKQAGSLMDIGCSSGSFLASFVGMPWKLYGIELSEDVASRARAKTGADIFAGDIQEAQFEPESFDVITSFDVLEHLALPAVAVDRVAAWLRPGGLFYVFIPNVDSWESRMFRSYWFGLELPRHLFHFSPTSLRALMARGGLKEVSLRTPPDNYIEHSVKYVVDDMAAAMGFTRSPLAEGASASLPFRVARKVARLTAFDAFGKVASRAGAGPAIEAVFRKE